MSIYAASVTKSLDKIPALSSLHFILIMPFAEKSIETTVSIRAERNSRTEIGTGFMFGFMQNQQNCTPVLFTNKHVVDGSDVVELRLSTSDPAKPSIWTGIYKIRITEHWRDIWLPHPDTSVDLGCLMLGPLLAYMQNQGFNGFGSMFIEADLLTQDAQAQLSAVEDVLMIGYPKGFYDEFHNRPLSRRGITASDARLPYNGRDEFVIDCATLHGSSGSPVILPEMILHRNQQGVIAGGRNGALLGIAFGGPAFESYGEVMDDKATTTFFKQTMHLASVISARKILDFKSLLGNLPTQVRTRVETTMTRGH